MIFERLPEGKSREYFGGEGLLICCANDDGMIINPFFKRTITESYEGAKQLYDIISPYGYAGPVARLIDTTKGDALWKSFFLELEQYCKENDIVSEFGRLHPLLDNSGPVKKYSDKSVVFSKKVVIIDLSLPEILIAAGMSCSRKRQIKKAKRNPNLNIVTEADNISHNLFFELYYATMKRSGAEQRFYFPKSFFEDAFFLLKEHLLVISVRFRDITVAMGLFLFYGDYSYYWLGASDAAYLQQYPMALLLDHAINKLKNMGLRYLILGGGLSANDGLFEFKLRFSKTTADYNVYTQVFLRKEYETLSALHRPRFADQSFFPAYRA
jgi:hypothetical protein